MSTKTSGLNESGEDVPFSPQLQKVISQVVPSNDPLDEPSFNATEYINSIFPDTNSLSELDPAIGRIRSRINRADEDILLAVREQVSSGNRGRQSLEESKNTIKNLFDSIGKIKMKAIQSEALLTELCADVRSLDYAKKNLMSTISTLEQLNTLMKNLKDLKGDALRRDYHQAGMKLKAVSLLVGRFKDYQHIPKIAQMTSEVNQIISDLKDSIWKEFDNYLRPNSTSSLQVLKDSTVVIEAMGKDLKKDFLTFFVDQTLDPYKAIFKHGEEASSLDQIDRRFRWLVEKGWTESYDKAHEKIFPPEWKIKELFTQEFCFVTREHLERILEEQRNTVNVETLITVIRKTVAFEKSLSAKFGTETAIVQEAEEPDEEDNLENEEGQNKYSAEAIKRRVKKYTKEKQKMNEAPKSKQIPKFQGIISSIFDLYLDLYIKSEDENMKQQLNTLLAAETWAADDVKNKVLNSSTELVQFINAKTKTCSSLSKGQAYFEIFSLCRKYINLYAQILSEHIPANEVKLNENSEQTICLIINTAEYYMNLLPKMVQKVKETIQPKFAPKIDLEEEKGKFQGIIGSALNRLVFGLLSKLEPHLNAMTRIAWATLSSPDDQSEYVNSIKRVIDQSTPIYVNWINNIKNYWSFCDWFWIAFAGNFLSTIHKCRQISDVGAQQMMVDVAAIRETLLDMSTKQKDLDVNEQNNQAFPKRYTKHLDNEMEKADHLVRIILVPPAALVPSYKSLWTAQSENHFRAIMDLKGIPKAEQKELMDQFVTASKNEGMALPTGVPSNEGSKWGKVFNVTNLGMGNLGMGNLGMGNIGMKNLGMGNLGMGNLGMNKLAGKTNSPNPNNK
eukprot:TRINITY_DN3519_c0_g2_i1.p1 TRINITY_DN3519_c0_g2~~TRINITY_DN3519_c0_g2_i1.p1  ORF type:complete len:846 (-),score=252.04 TRINITY_DN3519_c0_g2_i1:36-2573(-)